MRRHGQGLSSVMLALALAPMLVATSASPDPVRQLAGRYYRQFPDELQDGTKYTGENIVEIVPLTNRAAYVRAHLDFANAHVCSIAGVAQAEGNALVYRDRPPFVEQCVLTILRARASLRLDDDGNSCKSYCGARGSFTNVELPYRSRRPIGYLSRLRNSREYRAAITAWKENK